MALNTPGFDLIPSAERVAVESNYITNFDFLNQYLPDTYEKEFERYGNRTLSSFLRMVGAEMPSTSDMIKWAEQGRLHIKYTNCTADGTGGESAVWTINDDLTPAGLTTTGGNGSAALRIGQTVMISDNAGTGLTNKGVITAVSAISADVGGTITVAYYELAQVVPATACTIFIYGSEFKKGTEGMLESLESDDYIFENKPIILKDKYAVSGSDMAQIGWVEVTSENGASGYLWYLKSEHDTRLRFDDYLETAMIEAVPAVATGGAAKHFGNAAGNNGQGGSEGVFYVVENRGNVFGGGVPVDLEQFDTIIQRLDKQGAIEENALFVNRAMSFAIDDMLAAQNSYGTGGSFIWSIR